MIGLTSSAGVTKTLLWTNPSPTANFNSQIITISENYSKYDYIAIIYKKLTTSTNTHVSINDASVLSEYMSGYATYIFGSYYASCMYEYGRQIYHAMNEEITKLHISGSYVSNYNMSDDSTIIPIALYGLKGRIFDI